MIARYHVCDSIRGTNCKSPIQDAGEKRHASRPTSNIVLVE